MKNRDSTLFAGIDWASTTHMICVIDAGGAIAVRFEIPNTGKTFTGLVKRLTKLEVEAVAIERCDGPPVEALLDAGLRVVVIAPRQAKGLRSRYSGSGAKSDAGDAYLLADVLRTDGHRLAALAGVAPVTRASGKMTSVGFRWAADKKLRNALIDFAEDSRHASPWAANIYNQAIARGKRHPHAVRILARARVRVIWRCWQDHTAYNPQLHGGAMQLTAA